jgi:hypothetical protein
MGTGQGAVFLNSGSVRQGDGKACNQQNADTRQGLAGHDSSWLILFSQAG